MMMETAISQQDHALLVEKLGQLLIDKHLSLVVAESCTGGWLAKVITDMPGCSKWFDRGFVTYTNHAKQDMLGVKASTLAQFGAVSEQTVREMVEGAISHSQSSVAIAISGVAGPEGGTAEKPVGTVWFAWSKKAQPGKSCQTTAKIHLLAGNREAIRRESVKIALTGIVKHVQDGSAV